MSKREDDSTRDAPDGPSFDPATLAKLRATMKNELRRTLGAVRRALPADARALRDRAICGSTVALAPFAGARTLAAYSAVRGEVDPRPIVERAWELGQTVALPRVDRAAGTLGWYVHTPDRPLREGAFGIGEPGPDAPEVDPATIDLVLVPAVAYDAHGNRLGQGMGFYDRALPELVRAVRIGLAFDFQLAAELPHDPHDAPVDWVVTDKQVIETRARGSGLGDA